MTEEDLNKKALIQKLDQLKELAEKGKIDSITFAYRTGDEVNTAYVGAEIELLGLIGYLSADLQSEHAGRDEREFTKHLKEFFSDKD